MEQGEWYHEDHFLPLTEHIPRELACRCYLMRGRNTKRLAEEAFTQASRGAIEYVKLKLTKLAHKGILEREEINKKGCRTTWRYKLGKANDQNQHKEKSKLHPPRIAGVLETY